MAGKDLGTCLLWAQPPDQPGLVFVIFGLDVCHRQGDEVRAGLRKQTFVTNFTNKVKFSFTILLALKY